MGEQINLFGDIGKGKSQKREKINWENAFQRWCNAQFEYQTVSYGKCGYGIMCDWCQNNVLGNACVRALNQMCREKDIQIDYSKRNFENIWNGDFE